MFDIVLIDGPYNDARAKIKRQPDYILVGGKHYYARIDDPDTGESLDAYAYDR
jgi:hypothetical protein